MLTAAGDQKSGDKIRTVVTTQDAGTRPRKYLSRLAIFDLSLLSILMNVLATSTSDIR